MTLDEILKHAQPLVKEMHRRHYFSYPDSTVSKFEAIKGRKYVRLMRGFIDSDAPGFIVEGFIDIDGNILFGAHDGPYKYASAIRGNIFSDQKGFEAIAPTGHLLYLK